MSVADNDDEKPLLLLVEDDPDYRAVLQIILEMVPTAREYRVEILDCCDAALERFETTVPRVLVSDFNLPDRTGVDVCQAASELDASCLRVILTGLPEHVPVDDVGVGKAAEAVWEKGWEPGDLMERFDGLLRRGLAQAG